MNTYFVATSFFRNEDRSSTVYSVDVLGLFEDEEQAKLACIHYLKAELVNKLTEGDGIAAYLEMWPDGVEWLTEIEALETIDLSERLPYIEGIVEKVYEGRFGPFGPGVRIDQRVVNKLRLPVRNECELERPGYSDVHVFSP